MGVSVDWCTSAPSRPLYAPGRDEQPPLGKTPARLISDQTDRDTGE